MRETSISGGTYAIQLTELRKLRILYSRVPTAQSTLVQDSELENRDSRVLRENENPEKDQKRAAPEVDSTVTAADRQAQKR